MVEENASPYLQPDTINPKWIGYYALLWLALVMLSQIESIRDVVIAFAWLIAGGVMFLLLDPENPSNLFRKLGLNG